MCDNDNVTKCSVCGPMFRELFALEVLLSCPPPNNATKPIPKESTKAPRVIYL